MDKRGLLAIALCMGIFFFWMQVVMPRLYPEQRVSPAPAPAPAAAPEAVPVAPASGKPQDPVPAPVVEHAPAPPFTLQSKMLRVTMTNEGAGILDLTVTDPSLKGDVVLLRPYDASHPHLALRRIGGPGGETFEKRAWEVVEKTDAKVEFRIRTRDGLVLTKLFELDPAKHTLKLTLLVDNKNPVPAGKSAPDDVLARFELLAFNGLDPDSAYRYEQYLAAAWRDDKGAQLRPIPDVEKGESKLAEALREADPGKRADAVKATDEYLRVQTGRKSWFGLKSRFFAVLLKPDRESLEAIDAYRHRTPPADALAKYAEAGRGSKNLAVSAETKELRLSGRKVYQFELFAGPQKEEVLRELPGAEELLKFSTGCILSPIVNLVAPLILGLLKFTGGLLGNLGIGIIVTTLLIKLFVFPLTLKSQRSMAAMQALGPKIQALRERYGNDQQKFGMEQMKLFREHKVNPMAGCLPMLIQMPVFIGMYSVFEQAVELRNAPFFLWIKDLSQPDHLVGPWVPVEIPLLVTTLSIDAFNLLPIVMTLTWFLQAYVQPRSPDPQMASQQKMMMWMPVIFGLMCYGLASGLSLYFLVNSLLGMGEQKLIKKVFLPKPEPSNA